VSGKALAAGLSSNANRDQPHESVSGNQHGIGLLVGGEEPAASALRLTGADGIDFGGGYGEDRRARLCIE